MEVRAPWLKLHLVVDIPQWHLALDRLEREKVIRARETLLRQAKPGGGE
jgi:hypothetical protein